ncbi:hypothetical protein [Microcoleus phage My-WqHQDG]|nr:hypothetical protein [Microcoleus phage My-WqHQDG]
MKYIVKDIESYQRAIDVAWALASKKGEKELRIRLTGNTLTLTTLGGGAIQHSSVEVIGDGDGMAWVDGAQLDNVSSLLPTGRELTVSLGQALTYQVQGYSGQDIPLAATHPTIPDLGDREQLFMGVDLSDLNSKDSKALATLSLKDYAIVLHTQGSGAQTRIIIPTAYPCSHPFSTEVSAHILTFMRKMKAATIYYYPKGYMGLVDGNVELLVPITPSPSSGGVVDMVDGLPTIYSIKVQQQDLLSALNWTALSTPTAVQLSYSDPNPYIELRVADNSPVTTKGGKGTSTKVAFTQDDDDTASIEDTVLVIQELCYAPTTLLAALSALPKGSITLTGKVYKASGTAPSLPLLLLTHQGVSTVNVLLNALA